MKALAYMIGGFLMFIGICISVVIGNMDDSDYLDPDA